MTLGTTPYRLINTQKNRASKPLLNACIQCCLPAFTAYPSSVCGPPQTLEIGPQHPGSDPVTAALLTRTSIQLKRTGGAQAAHGGHVEWLAVIDSTEKCHGLPSHELRFHKRRGGAQAALADTRIKLVEAYTDEKCRGSLPSPAYVRRRRWRTRASRWWR